MSHSYVKGPDPGDSSVNWTVSTLIPEVGDAENRASGAVQALSFTISGFVLPLASTVFVPRIYSVFGRSPDTVCVWRPY
ncbi:MAG TPA: hypothetical protein PK955_01685, partial [Methanoregulaceae archaeon]|nr:hypothetical protein [Methanoregulaceae archaeon]